MELFEDCRATARKTLRFFSSIPFSIWRSWSFVLQLALQNRAFLLIIKTAWPKLDTVQILSEPVYLGTPTPFERFENCTLSAHWGGHNTVPWRQSPPAGQRDWTGQQRLVFLTLSVLFMWKPFRPLLVNESNSVSHHLTHAKNIVLIFFSFFVFETSLWSLKPWLSV